MKTNGTSISQPNSNISTLTPSGSPIVLQFPISNSSSYQQHVMWPFCSTFFKYPKRVISKLWSIDSDNNRRLLYCNRQLWTILYPLVIYYWFIRFKGVFSFALLLLLVVDWTRVRVILVRGNAIFYHVFEHLMRLLPHSTIGAAINYLLLR